jgi:hypothetical protein
MTLWGAVTLGLPSLDTITGRRRHQKWLNHLTGRMTELDALRRSDAAQPARSAQLSAAPLLMTARPL